MTGQAREEEEEGLNCLVWQDIIYILIHFLPNSHICVLLQFIFTYVTQL